MAKKKADPVVLALRALAARQAGSNEQAERLLTAALRGAPRHPALLQARAAVRRDQGLLCAAREDLVAAGARAELARFPDAEAAAAESLAAARALSRSGRGKAAAAAALDAVSSFGGGPAALARAAAALDGTAAATHLRRLMSESKVKAEAVAASALTQRRAHFRAGRFAHGARSCRLARAALPGDALPARLDRLRLALAAGDFADAEREARALRAATRDPVALSAAMHPGFWETADGGWAVPPEPARRWLAARARRYAARGDRAWAYVLTSSLSPAPSSRRLREGLRPADAYAGYAFGLVLSGARRFEEAARCFHAAARTCEPPYWRALAFAAEAELAAGRRAASARTMTRARVAAAATSPAAAVDARVWQGLLLLMMKRYAAAAARLAPVAARSRYGQAWLGAALLRLGRPAAALPRLTAAMKADPGDEEAAVLRAETLVALGRRREALATARALARRWPLNPFIPLVALLAAGPDESRSWWARAGGRVRGKGAALLGRRPASHAERVAAARRLLEDAGGCRARRYEADLWRGERPVAGAPRRPGWLVAPLRTRAGR